MVVGSAEVRGAADSVYLSPADVPPFVGGAPSPPGESVLASALAPFLSQQPLHTLIDEHLDKAKLPDRRSFASLSFGAAGTAVASWSPDSIYESTAALSPGDPPSRGRLLCGEVLHGPAVQVPAARPERYAEISWNVSVFPGHAQLDSSSRWVSMLHQSTNIREPLSAVSKQFAAAFRRKAFLHWFTGEGTDEMEFTEAESNIYNVISALDAYKNREQDDVVDVDDVDPRIKEP